MLYYTDHSRYISYIHNHLLTYLQEPYKVTNNININNINSYILGFPYESPPASMLVYINRAALAAALFPLLSLLAYTL